MPREYGAPTGVEKPITTGRTKAAPSTPAAAKSYLDHILEADRAHPQSVTRRPPSAGSGAKLSDMTAKGRPPVGIGGQQRRATIDDAVEKMQK